MDNEDDRTVWCGNLSDSITEELIFELFLQVAPVERVRIPQDRAGRKSNYAFIVFKHSISVPYVVDLLNGISVFDKKLNIKPRQCNQSTIRDRLGPKVDGDSRNDNVLPVNTIPFNNLDNLYFQNLLHLGQMMNVVPTNNPYITSPDNRHYNQRNRSERRGEIKPYDRHERYGRNNAHSYENQRKHRRY